MTKKQTAISPVDLLDSLRAYSFLAPYSMAIHEQGEGLIARSISFGQLCGTAGTPSACKECCTYPLDDAIRESMARRVPVIGRCPLGLLGFAIRLPDPAMTGKTLLVWGVRTSSINLFYLESMSRHKGVKPFVILEKLGGLPVVELQDVREITDRVDQLLPSLLSSRLPDNAMEATVSRLNSVVGISTQLDRAKTLDQVVSLLSESFGVLFDCQQIAVAMSGQDSEAFAIKGTWGLPLDLGQTSRVVLHRLMADHPGERSLQLISETSEFFQTLNSESATFLPLMAGSELLGCVLLPNLELQPRDTLFAEILTGRAATRIQQLRNEANQYSGSSLPARLIAMTSSMSCVKTVAQLHEKVLETAANFLGAASGSFMLVDETGHTLKIAAARGLNEQLSKSLHIRMGEGIAGKVAATGEPIVVNDIETDSRVATANRPRYKTKSFISAPFRHGERIIGVLNLSDKESNDIFTENDLQLLALLLGQASMVLERTQSRQQADLLLNLSAIDPATNLYNRSFLDKRLAEEVNRSQRQSLEFSIFMIELDYLNLYVSVCGPAAGATVIKKCVKAISRSARQMDVVCCYDSETYCIILPGTSKQKTLPVSRRITKAFARLRIPGSESLPKGKISASIGVAVFPTDGETAEKLMDSALQALQQAKAEGRDRIVFYETRADNLEVSVS